MKNIIYSVIFLFLMGCSEKSEKNNRYTEGQVSSLNLGQIKARRKKIGSLEIVDINRILRRNIFAFQDLVKTIRLVPLETTKKSRIGPIYKVLATDSHIYIYDKVKSGGLAVFDHEGRFIRRIPNGKGSGELSGLYDIDFDEENNQLIAYEHSFLSFYSPDGEFIREESLPFDFFNIMSIPNGYLISVMPGQGNGGGDAFRDFNLWVTDKNFKVISVELPSHFVNISYYTWYRYLYKNKEIIVTQKFNDTIYQYEAETNRLQAKYLLDFHETKLPESYLEEGYAKFESASIDNDYFFYIGEYLEAGDFQLFCLRNRHRRSRSVVYRDKKSGNLTGGAISGFRIEDMPDLPPPQSTYKDEFISWYTPKKDFPFNTQSKILSETDKAKVRDLTKEDNPVLVFFRLNDF
ncbi:6-bladed beta-propeller [Echinicola strongylocentroti]|nr:6-bladed beta-propeller [Echinicola strongylocentroti]